MKIKAVAVAISLSLVGIGTSLTIGRALPQKPHAKKLAKLTMGTRGSQMQPVGQQYIQEIDVTGNHHVSTVDIMKHVGAKPGDIWDVNKFMAKDLTAIFSMGQFTEVGPCLVAPGNKSNHVIVTVPVVEKQAGATQKTPTNP